MTAPISADEARRLREAAMERAVAGGPVGYVQRMRAAHAATFTSQGNLGACECGSVGCSAPIWLAHVDNLIQAYRNKVGDLAAETKRSSDLAAEVERLSAAPCPQIIQGDEGTAYCALAEATVERLSEENERLREALRGLTRFGQHPACLLATRYGSGRACSVCEATTAGLAALSDEGEQ